MLFAGMAAQGESPLSLLLGGSGRLAQPGRHYPLGDIYDFASHTQAYYHRHTDAEFGHLHLFVRPKGMPEGMRPLVATGQADAPCHLAAVVLNGAGQAVELFTTNRWVTGEDWYAAADIEAMAAGFRLATLGRLEPLAQWIEALVTEHARLIADLALAREETVAAWRRDHPGSEALDDSRLEVTSRQRLDDPA